MQLEAQTQIPIPNGEFETTNYLDQGSIVDITSTPEIDVSFDVSAKFQTVEGFGAGIKRGTKDLYSLDNITRNQIEKYCFQDLEVNMIRFFVYHTLEPVNDNLDPFLLDETQLDWKRYDSGTARQNFFVAEALNNAFSLSVNGFDEVIGNANSAPGWLKTTGTHNNGGTLITGGEDEYSEFLLAFLKGMKSRYNINVTAISPTNEPDYEVGYESMNTSPLELNSIIKNLNLRLQTESLTNVKIISPECFRVHHPKRLSVSTTNYINTMFTDMDVQSAVDVVATHTYADKTHDANWGALKTAALNKPVWVTESANLDSDDTSMTDAAHYVKWILRGFNEGGMTAYMQHTFYQEMKAGDLSSALVVWKPDGTIILPKRYFVLKHFANLVKKGYKVMGSNTILPNAIAGAFISPDGSRVVLQILNEGAAKTISIDAPSGTTGITHYITSNDVAEEFTLTNDITFTQGDELINLNMPAMSMHSIVYDIDSSLSISENMSAVFAKVKLYPNPASNEITMEFPVSGNYNLSVYHLNGAKVFDAQVTNSSSHKLDINRLASGFYFVKIDSDIEGLNSTLKFIKN